MDTNNIFFESVSNSSPTCTIDEEEASYASSPNQSMVTYKTNYVREAAQVQPAVPVPAEKVVAQDQQSTPYMSEGAAAKVRKLRLSTGGSNSNNGGVQRSMRKSLTVNFCKLMSEARRRSRTNDSVASSSSGRNETPVNERLLLKDSMAASVHGLQEQHVNMRLSRKCRRSNTTYTVAGGNNRNSKIIDYFTK
jgi:hypothetical protein